MAESILKVNFNNGVKSIRSYEHADGSISFISQVAGTTVQESKTNVMVESGTNTLLFNEEIDGVAIHHEDEGVYHEFIVNGITLHVPAGGMGYLVGGTPSLEVEIPAGLACAVYRLS